MHLGTPPYSWTADDTPPEWAAAEIDAAMAPDDRPYHGDSPCLWLDLETRRCRNYDIRPRVCQEFEPGEEDCLNFRERAGVGRLLFPLALV